MQNKKPWPDGPFAIVKLVQPDMFCPDGKQPVALADTFEEAEEFILSFDKNGIYRSMKATDEEIAMYDEIKKRNQNGK